MYVQTHDRSVLQKSSQHPQAPFLSHDYGRKEKGDDSGNTFLKRYSLLFPYILSSWKFPGTYQ